MGSWPLARRRRLPRSATPEFGRLGGLEIIRRNTHEVQHDLLYINPSQ